MSLVVTSCCQSTNALSGLGGFPAGNSPSEAPAPRAGASTRNGGARGARPRVRRGDSRPAAAPALTPSASARAEIHHPAARAGRALALGGLSRDERLQRFAPDELAAGLGKQVHARGESARHQQGVAVELAHGAHAACAVGLADRDGPHAPAAVGAQHRRAPKRLDAGAPRGLGQHAARGGAHVGDDRDLDALRMQIQRRLVRGIAGGHDGHAIADPHAIAVQISLRGAGQHDARPVVARKYQRPLDGAGREHHAPRAHLPKPLARQVRGRRRQMIGQALVRAR